MLYSPFVVLLMSGDIKGNKSKMDAFICISLYQFCMTTRCVFNCVTDIPGVFVLLLVTVVIYSCCNP